MGVLAKVFKSRDSSRVRHQPSDAEIKTANVQSAKGDDPWLRKTVGHDEVQQLLHICTQEVKSRALDTPFLLLPFRPHSDRSAARNFIRGFFRPTNGGNSAYDSERLSRELKLIDPLVLCNILKWCWSRLPGGVVTWNTYELFRIGELDSQTAKNAFEVFIPLSVESLAHQKIVVDFFDLLAAIAANGKSNGLGGRKLSRLAGWWAFDHSDTGGGFNGGYKSWARAADATSHLFFAYLRALAPDNKSGTAGVSKLPRSLLALLSQTEYPPHTPELLLCRTSKVIMDVKSVSSTPYSLLKRSKDFEYGPEEPALRRFTYSEDPIEVLTPECRRVVEAISAINSGASETSKKNVSSTATDASWSKFEDIGFSSVLGSSKSNAENADPYSRLSGSDGVRPSGGSTYASVGRPVTPSWADFLSSGFSDDESFKGKPSLLLPPDQILPPLSPEGFQSPHSRLRGALREDNLEPGELISVKQLDLDETFWWVWMTSWSDEETADRKAVFGRCAFIETEISGARWLILEEQLKGVQQESAEDLFVIEKRTKFSSFTRRGRPRMSSTGKQPPIPSLPYQQKSLTTPQSRSTIGPDQQAKVQAAAAALIRQKNTGDNQKEQTGRRRARTDENADSKTTSVISLGLQPVIMKEAGAAMQWQRKFDKEAVRQQYLGDNLAGKGVFRESSPTSSSLNLPTSLSAGEATTLAHQQESAERRVPAPMEAAQPAGPPNGTAAASTAQIHGSIQAYSPDASKPPVAANEEPVASEEASREAVPQPSTLPPVPIADAIVIPHADPPDAAAPSAIAPEELTATGGSVEGAAPPPPALTASNGPKAVAVNEGSPAPSDAPVRSEASNVAPAATAAAVAAGFGAATAASATTDPPTVTSSRTALQRKAVASVDSTDSRGEEPRYVSSTSEARRSTQTQKVSSEKSPAAVAATGAWSSSKTAGQDSVKTKAATLQKSQKGSSKGLRSMFKKKSTPTEPTTSQKPSNGSALAPEPKLSRTPSFLRRKAAAEAQTAPQPPVSQPGVSAPTETTQEPAAVPVSAAEPVDIEGGEPGPVVTTDTDDQPDFTQRSTPAAPYQAVGESNAQVGSVLPEPAEDVGSAEPTVQASNFGAATPPDSEPSAMSEAQPNTLFAGMIAPDPSAIVPIEPRSTEAASPVIDEDAAQTYPGTADETETHLADDEESPRQSFTAPTTVAPGSMSEAPPEAEALDRWAKIRQTAAERKAAEEKSRGPTHQSQTQSVETERTDDGETSGEETIESRVARIKARVAELTGSAQQSPAQ